MKKSFFPRAGFLLAALFFLNACSKNDNETAPPTTTADITGFSLAGQSAQATISESTHTITVQLPSTVSSGKGLVAAFSLSPGCTASVNNKLQVSGATANDFSTDVSYTITTSQHTSQVWTVTIVNNDYSYRWGLGHFVQQTLSNNRDYNWYIDQATTGTFALVNCGPASVTMVCKWADSTYTNDARYARSMYEPQGGWWYSRDIDGFLNNEGIPHAILALAGTSDSTEQIIEQILNNDEILIFNPDMNIIPLTGQDAYHAYKFYPTTPAWGHYAVIKGYKKVDGETFFETYDPYSFFQTNPDDGMPKGENRYYRAEDVYLSAFDWWNYIFVIAGKGNEVHRSSQLKSLDVNKIPVGSGR